MKFLRVKASHFKNCCDGFTIDLTSKSKKTAEDTSNVFFILKKKQTRADFREKICKTVKYCTLPELEILLITLSRRSGEVPFL